LYISDSFKGFLSIAKQKFMGRVPPDAGGHLEGLPVYPNVSVMPLKTV
jgi:hypothetical protein